MIEEGMMILNRINGKSNWKADKANSVVQEYHKPKYKGQVTLSQKNLPNMRNDKLTWRSAGGAKALLRAVIEEESVSEILQARRKQQEQLMNIFYPDSVEELDENLRKQWPRKGRLEVEVYQERKS